MSLLQLDDPVIQQIARFVVSPTDKFCLSLACTRLRRLVCDRAAWPHGVEVEISHSNDSFDGCTNVKLKCGIWSSKRTKLRDYRALSIHLACPDVRVRVRDLDQYTALLRHLDSLPIRMDLTLEGLVRLDELDEFPRLQTLHAFNFNIRLKYNVPFERVQTLIGSSASHLTRITLPFFYTFENLDIIFREFSNLESLRFALHMENPASSLQLRHSAPSTLRDLAVLIRFMRDSAQPSWTAAYYCDIYEQLLSRVTTVSELSVKIYAVKPNSDFYDMDDLFPEAILQILLTFLTCRTVSAHDAVNTHQLTLWNWIDRKQERVLKQDALDVMVKVTDDDNSAIVAHDTFECDEHDVIMRHLLRDDITDMLRQVGATPTLVQVQTYFNSLNRIELVVQLKHLPGANVLVCLV